MNTPDETRVRPIAFTVAFYAFIIGGLYSAGFVFSNGWAGADASPQRDMLYRIYFWVLPVAVTIAVVHIAIVILTGSNRRIQSESPTSDRPIQKKETSPKHENSQRSRDWRLEFAILIGVGSGVGVTALFVLLIFTSSDPEAGMALIALPWFFAFGSIAGFLLGLFFCRK